MTFHVCAFIISRIYTIIVHNMKCHLRFCMFDGNSGDFNIKYTGIVITDAVIAFFDHTAYYCTVDYLSA